MARVAPCVADDDYVLLQLSSGETKLQRVRLGTKVAAAGKAQVLVDPLIGAPFGATFRVESSSLIRDERTVEQIKASLGDAICAQPSASNADLVDHKDGRAQSMGEEDIRRLKQKGTDGAAVVKAIAAASATFAGKTEFAQEKYLRKKAKKHMPFVTVARPTPLSVCDMFMHKSPEKLLHLRRDSLALLLGASNAQPGARVLVVESTLGLLAGAAAQRLGGEGRVVAATLGKPCLDGVHWLNLGPERRARSRKLTYLKEAALAAVAAEGFTNLIVAVRDAPSVALLALLDRLVPGSPFAIYHPSITPLAECFHICQQARAGVRLQLLECWARPYQVAHNRTHPEMNAYPATGYVLSGVAVLRS